MQQQELGHKKSSRVVTFNEEKYTTKTRPNDGLLSYTLCRTTIQHTYLPFVVPEKLSEVLVSLETRKKTHLTKTPGNFKYLEKRVTDCTREMTSRTYLGIAFPIHVLYYLCLYIYKQRRGNYRVAYTGPCFGTIDVQDHLGQGSLALERKWHTQMVAHAPCICQHLLI